jgi:hypothetical protein
VLKLLALVAIAALTFPAVALAGSSAVVTAPEPATGLLIAAGVGAGIAAVRRRQKKQK